MFIDILKNRLSEQGEMYDRVRSGDTADVCYKKFVDKTYGTSDANYIGRLRLVYYLLYWHINDEQTIAYLFGEELKDRASNSFQGIGNSLEILTYLLKKYDKDDKYKPLFERAKNANFDCACGYNENVRLSEDINSNNLIECIYLAEDMKYYDVMATLVDEWKSTISDWNEQNIRQLIRFNLTVGRSSENETLHKQLLAECVSKGDIMEIAGAYRDLIKYYTEQGRFDDAYVYHKELLENHDLSAIKNIRLYSDLIELAADIVSGTSGEYRQLWKWAKRELKNVRQMYGNLYTKCISAAQAAGDPFADILQTRYKAWRKKFDLK